MASPNGTECQDVFFPIEVYGAVGGLLNKKALICGGILSFWDYSDGCYVIGEGNDVVVTMTEKRLYAASVVHHKQLLITGGRNGNNYLKSTEWISLEDGSGSSTNGGDLPMTLYGHSMVAINTSMAMIIGGYSNGYSDKTFYFNPMEQPFIWTDGPPLMQARYFHASALLGQYVVTAGGSGGGSSVEILDLNSSPHQWTQGKLFLFFLIKCFLDLQVVPTYQDDFPIILCSNGQLQKKLFHENIFLMKTKSYKLQNNKKDFIFFLGPSLPKEIRFHSMVTIENKVILIGGFSPGDGYLKDILKLQCATCHWEHIGYLQQAREDFVAIPIPGNLTNLPCY